MNDIARHQAVSIAEDMLAGKVDILNGCAKLVPQLYAAGLDKDPNFRIFVVVWSDCDHLPIGHVRQHWDIEALKLKDEEIAEINSFYRKDVLIACGRLVALMDS